MYNIVYFVKTFVFFVMSVNMQTAMAEDPMLYLSDKRTVLDNPGFKLNDLYAHALNVTVQSIQCTFNLGRYFQSLSQLQFNSQSSVLIPNQSFLSTCYLHLELPPILANQSLCRGWGYAAINNITFLFGSANVSQLPISGQSLFQLAMMQCETAEKRSEMLRLAGNEYLAPTPSGQNLYADVLLVFPWSTACGIHPKKPFDTSLLNNPIQITIQFNQNLAIYGGTATMPTQFLAASIIPRQGELENCGNSLRNQLMLNPSLSLPYPFIHHQSFSPSQFNGSNTQGTPVSLTLQSFINADLLAITVGVVQNAFLSPSGNSTPNPFAYDPMYNISLKFNGQVMFYSPGYLWKQSQMLSMPGAGYIHGSFVNPGNTQPFTSNPVDSYILTIDFSRIRALCWENTYQNVWRIPTNVLTLDFNTLTTNTYTMFLTYSYNGVADIKAGMANIYFD